MPISRLEYLILSMKIEMKVKQMNAGFDSEDSAKTREKNCRHLLQRAKVAMNNGYL